MSLDARPVDLPGIGRFTTELALALARLADPGTVVPLRARHRRRGGWLGAAAFPPLAGSVPVRSRLYGPGEQFELGGLLRRLGVDVHHATHLSVPYRSPVPVVLTVHDVFPLTHPEHARSAAARAYYRAVLPAAVRRATAVVAVSEYTAAEIRRVVGVRPRAVIGHGADHAAWKEAVGEEHGIAGVAGPYILYVGTAKPHKNLVTLLAAHRLGAGVLPPLVLAGPTGAEVDRIRGAALTAGAACRGAVGTVSGDRPPSPNRVVTLGRVPDHVLPSLYRGAAVVAVPSLYEGVGLAALEAMALGVPVVASDAPGLRDTVGDAAALVPPTDVTAWADALQRMTRSSALRDVVVERGLRRAASHRWEDVAAAYLELYRSVTAR